MAFCLAYLAQKSIGAEEGIKRSRDIRRLPDDESWDRGILDKCQATFREFIDPSSTRDDDFDIPGESRESAGVKTTEYDEFGPTVFYHQSGQTSSSSRVAVDFTSLFGGSPEVRNDIQPAHWFTSDVFDPCAGRTILITHPTSSWPGFSGWSTSGSTPRLRLPSGGDISWRRSAVRIGHGPTAVGLSRPRVGLKSLFADSSRA